MTESRSLDSLATSEAFRFRRFSDSSLLALVRLALSANNALEAGDVRSLFARILCPANDTMPPLIHYRTVEFHETDAAGLVHFSNYLRYAEAAEHALFREIGYPIMLEAENGDFYGWPRVRADAKYSAPLVSGDPLRVQLAIRELKDRAIVYVFRVYHDTSNTLAAKGTFTTMHTHRDPLDRSMRAVAIPERLIQLLKPYCVGS